ncbi:MAG: heat shock protein HspQ [Proteobacteria bacterium]|nr:heat shock protein HspQ [Pseudomonadota bacterium]
MNKKAKFNIGDCVIHTSLGYRAIIIDVDPLFQASGKPNPQARKREFANKNPWYRLLVDDSNQTTYVEEPLLRIDLSEEGIDNPQVKNYFKESKGHYSLNNKHH